MLSDWINTQKGSGYFLLSDWIKSRRQESNLTPFLPHDWYRQNQLARYEGYYASIVYCCLAALGLNVIAEDMSNQGRVDLTVKLAEKIFIIEFKVLEGKRESGRALAQIKARKYWQKYATGEFQVMLIGIEFDKSERNIVHFEWEAV